MIFSSYIVNALTTLSMRLMVKDEHRKGGARGHSSRKFVLGTMATDHHYATRTSGKVHGNVYNNKSIDHQPTVISVNVI
jgi:hypothetical protein